MVGNAGKFVGRSMPAVVLVSAIGLSACSPVYQTHGYVPSEKQLSMIEVGRDTRDTVGDFLGRPASSGVLDSGDWYYVSSRFKDVGLKPSEEVSREVVAINFSKSGTVSGIEHYNLKDGRKVPLERRVTDSNIRGVGFFRQLLGNLGVIDASQLVDNDGM